MSYGLDEFGLPDDYFDLTTRGQKGARRASLTSWFDPDRPDVLCTDVDAYVSAHRLWTEFYMKPAKCNRALYTRPDPRHKYKMVRAIMSPAIVETEPAKTVIHAPRGTAKTVTCIREACSMIPVVRPDTHIVISEQNSKRTGEEIEHIQEQIEENEIIHQDFGGLGRLYPGNRATRDRWNSGQLDFIHNRSAIYGVSVNSSHRGRHPLLWIIDDPEPEEGFNELLREKYFRWLFRSGMGMLSAGCHMFWLGTPPNENACLMIALRGVQNRLVEGDDIVMEPDHRFDDWTKLIFPAITQDADTGELQSVWPERISVEGFEHKKQALGEAAAMAEYQGEIIAEGTRVLHRQEFAHGFMVCCDANDPAQAPSYMLDLKTGERRDWKEWLSELAVVAAVDPADSLSPSADPGCMVVGGVNPTGVIYVLDCVVRKQIADRWVEEAFPLAMSWNCLRLGWEKVTFQTIIFRHARWEMLSLRSQGKNPPICVPVSVHNRGVGSAYIYKKALRIVGTISPLLINETIRFRRLEEFEDSHGITHHPAAYGNGASYRTLKRQIDRMTDKGTGGHDDAADACYMMIRVAGGMRGSETATPADGNEAILSSLENAGMAVDLRSLPYDTWTSGMRREYAEAMAADAFQEDSDDLYRMAVYE